MSLQLFPEPIQREIAAVQQGLRQAQGRWPAEVRLTIDALASIYDCYPYLFLPAFPAIPAEQVHRLALAGRLYASSVFVLDHLVDQDAASPLETQRPLQILAMQHEAYLLLQQLFPPGAAFWPRFQTYLGEHTTACLAEQRLIAGEGAWSEWRAQARAVARGKNGLARATLAGLAELSGDERQLATLAASIDDYNLARQLLDDLLDWKEDLRRGSPSLLLCRVLDARPAPGAEPPPALARRIYYEGHAAALLQEALEALELAEQPRDALPELAWWHMTAQLRRRCAELQDDVERIVSGNRRRQAQRPTLALTLPEPDGPAATLAWPALEWLLQQWRLGFGEARHLMSFPRQLGFQAPQEHHAGDVFQRALVADILCDADGRLGGQLGPLLASEVDYLISARRESGVGGWSYFPTLPELPPDADDLAQVMQVLLRSGRRDLVADHCERPLTALLSEAAHGDGSFETWIVPAAPSSPEQQRQAEFVRTAWGSGPDSDVIANLLYALWLYDPGRFDDVLQRGGAYLERSQHPDGYWRSTWYQGPFYGTYVGCRCLAAIRASSPALRASLNYLASSQRPDGGWGDSDGSHPLSTALAMLALAALEPLLPMPATLASRAVDYLTATRAADGGWDKRPFIRMELGRATGKVSHVLSYGSRTISTAFALKALLAWMPRPRVQGTGYRVQGVARRQAEGARVGPESCPQGRGSPAGGYPGVPRSIPKGGEYDRAL